MGDLEKEIRKDKPLISISAVNNEIGSIQPIDVIGEMLRQYPGIH